MVALIAYSEARGGAVFCSGTLIAPTWVLTAAHCLEAAGQYGESGFDLYVAVGDDLFSQDGIDEAVQAAETFLHPGYTGLETLPPAWDVGLIELVAAIESADPVPFSAAAPDLSWRDEDLDLVGWGVTDDGATDAGLKRHVSAPYDTHDTQFIYVWSPGTNVCQGDSGGAMFRQTDAGRVLVGVHSFVFSESASVPPCAAGGSASTRTDQVLDFIDDHLDIDAAGGVVTIDGLGGEGSGGLPAELGGACQSAPGGGLLGLLVGAVGLARRQRASETV